MLIGTNGTNLSFPHGCVARRNQFLTFIILCFPTAAKNLAIGGQWEEVSNCRGGEGQTF